MDVWLYYTHTHTQLQQPASVVSKMSHLRGHMLHLLLKIKNKKKKKPEWNLSGLRTNLQSATWPSGASSHSERFSAVLRNIAWGAGKDSKEPGGTVASSGHKDVRWTEKSNLDWTVSAHSRHVKETLKAKNEFCKSLGGEDWQRCPGIKIRVDGLNEINYKLKNDLNI